VINGKNPLSNLATFAPFGPTWTGGVTVAGGVVKAGTSAEVIVGTASVPAGKTPQVKIYSIAGGIATQVGATIKPFTTAVGVQLTVVNVTGTGVSDVVIGALNPVGNVTIKIIDGAGAQHAQYNVPLTGKGSFKTFAFTRINSTGSGPDSLLFSGFPSAGNQLLQLDPMTGVVQNTFSGLTALNGAVALAGQ
jgi:hypothetical protein